MRECECVPSGQGTEYKHCDAVTIREAYVFGKGKKQWSSANGEHDVEGHVCGQHVGRANDQSATLGQSGKLIDNVVVGAERDRERAKKRAKK